MVELFTYVAKKIGDSLLSDAIKAVKDKPKRFGKHLLETHRRLKELDVALTRFNVALTARADLLDGKLPFLPEDQIGYFVEREHFFFEEEEFMLGTEMRFSGWSRISGTDNFEPVFQQIDGDPEIPRRYPEFVDALLSTAAPDSYRAMQRAAISLKQIIGFLPEDLLSVAEPELHKLLRGLALGDALYATWIFDAAPSFRLNDANSNLRIDFIEFDENANLGQKTIDNLLERAKDMPIDEDNVTFVSLERSEEIQIGVNHITSLQKAAEESAERLRKFIVANWKLQELI